MKHAITTLIIISMVFTSVLGQTSLDKISLKNGTYNVGFKHFISIDSARSYQRIYDWTNEYIPRQIPISIWYPANSGSYQQLEVLDYMRILKEEEEWEYLPDEFILNWFYYPNTPENQNHLTEATTAFLNADVVDNKFPVIIYAPSYQASSIENFALCEFLASHGFVVISSPSRGPNNRNFDKDPVKNAETQARDIQYLISMVSTFDYVDTKRMATMGFSYGGLSNVLAYSYNKELKAVISLDGSIKYQYSTLEKSPFYRVDDFDIPFIHFSQKDIPMEVMIADNIDTTLNNQFHFFDQLTHSYAYHFKFNNLTHSYFSTLGVLFQTRDPRQDKSDSEIMESYRWMAEYTLQFLNAYLINNPDTEEWLSRNPSENGFNDSVITTIDIKNPVSRELTFKDFINKASADEYNNLNELYGSFLERNPDFEVPEGVLNNLGLQLVFNPKTSVNGIKIFEFATFLYPSSANLYDSMGEAYLFVGEQDKALSSFKRSLELDPNNNNARKRISVLSK